MFNLIKYFINTILIYDRVLLPSNRLPLDSGGGLGCSDLFWVELGVAPDSC